jgi:hypothetical protein
MTRRYKLPNRPLANNDFGSTGGFELWNLMIQLWYRTGRLEVAVLLGGSILLALLSAIVGRVFEVW